MKNKLETCDIFIDWVLIVHGVKSVRIRSYSVSNSNMHELSHGSKYNMTDIYRVSHVLPTDQIVIR